MSRNEQRSETVDSWKLIPLTPGYIDDEHGGYVAAIEAALADRDVRNIALSGNYGVGKSSIMQEVANRQMRRVVELSLSTLAPIEATKVDEAVPVQATTPTNRIQQELINQLLYCQDPRKTPASRFRRIERFGWLGELGTAALIGLTVAVIFLLDSADHRDVLLAKGSWRLDAPDHLGCGSSRSPYGESIVLWPIPHQVALGGICDSHARRQLGVLLR
ncbi:hypothetical protein [Pseudoclavibacter sp. VKM Ac-2888]|uniref:YobI family P-loop NTPase n=1 Tax=Pseudoclavibacter sp. VKM Ac-2888 TaxID=2783830 RepID=UPI001E533831|nr:hypothetical protein [Pseudoclavibacter sp. VKM Ac-2888]